MPVVAVTLAHSVVVGDQVLAAHGQGQCEDAVAAIGGLQRVAVCAAHGELVSAPAVGSLALADGGSLACAVGRVDHQREVVGAVTAEDGLQVEVAGAGGGHGVAAPVVRQFGVTDGVGLIEGIARVDGYLHLVAVDTAEAVDHCVGVVSRLCQGATAPGVGAAGAEVNGRVGVHVRRVDSEGEDVNAVHARAGRQGVVIDTRGGEGATAPGV